MGGLGLSLGRLVLIFGLWLFSAVSLGCYDDLGRLVRGGVTIEFLQKMELTDRYGAAIEGKLRQSGERIWLDIPWNEPILIARRDMLEPDISVLGSRLVLLQVEFR